MNETVWRAEDCRKLTLIPKLIGPFIVRRKLRSRLTSKCCLLESPSTSCLTQGPWDMMILSSDGEVTISKKIHYIAEKF